MSKAKKVKAGKLYTNGRAQVVYVHRNSLSLAKIYHIVPIQNVDASKFSSLWLTEDELLKRWPYVVDKIIIEQDEYSEDEFMPSERKSAG
jgi:hypothetical protein